MGVGPCNTVLYQSGGRIEWVLDRVTLCYTNQGCRIEWVLDRVTPRYTNQEGRIEWVLDYM